MRDALDALVRFQQEVPAAALPPLDGPLLARQLALFPEWCVQREFGITWSAPEQAAWQRLCSLLIESALTQPRVAVRGVWTGAGAEVGGAGRHSSCQDALAGPITYDLVALLRDGPLALDEPQEIDWAVRWWDRARRAGLPVDTDFGEFWRALEWTGLQRHLMVMGRLSLLKHRDGQPQAAQALPHFLACATRVALRYRPLGPLLKLLEPLSGARVQPGFTF